jgi:hypothetical protein
MEIDASSTAEGRASQVSQVEQEEFALHLLIIMFPGHDPYSEDTGAGSGQDASTMPLDHITPDLPGCTRIDHFRENKLLFVRAAEELLRGTYRSRPLYETHVDQPRAAQGTSPKHSSHIQSLLDLRVLERWDVDDHVYCGTYFAVEEGITATARPIFNGSFLPVPSVCPPVDLLPV